MNLTGEILKKLAPGLSLDMANNYANLYKTICPIYGINSADIFHEYIANVLHESGGLTRFVEGLNYQAVALTKKFGRHRISIDDCYRYGRTMKQKANQQMIANILYGGQWGLINLGNKQQGDGWMFRGSGEMQITGRGLTTKFATYYNNLKGTSYTPEQMAELLRTNKEVSTHASCWLFAIEKKLITAAVNDEDLKIRRSINGGTFGIDEVLRLTALAEKLIV